MSDHHEVFDRALRRKRRERAADRVDEAGALLDELVARTVERLDEIRRPLDRVLVLGSHKGRLARAVAARPATRLVVETDLAPGMLGEEGPRVVADEERVPFAARTFDAVVSAGVLHHVNDLPGTLAQLRSVLRADGLLLLSMAGGASLVELREALMDAELAQEGGASPRVAPFIDVRDAGALLQRAGFALPVVDVDKVTIAYDTPLALIGDLRRLGETSTLRERRRGGLRRATLGAALGLYAERFPAAEGRVRASFDIVFMTGWTPHASQPKALRPGTAAHDLAAHLRHRTP